MDIKLNSLYLPARNFFGSSEGMKRRASTTTMEASSTTKDMPISSSGRSRISQPEVTVSSSPEDIFQNFLSHPSGCLFLNSNGNSLIQEKWMNIKTYQPHLPLWRVTLRPITPSQLEGSIASEYPFYRCPVFQMTLSQFIQLLSHLKISIIYNAYENYLNQKPPRSFRTVSSTYQTFYGIASYQLTISEIQSILYTHGIQSCQKTWD